MKKSIKNQITLTVWHKFQQILYFKRIRGATIISLCVNLSYLLSLLIYPYMPNISAVIRKQLNVPTFNVKNESPNPQDYDSDNIKPGTYEYPVFYSTFTNFLKEGHKIGKIEPLFKRIADTDVKVLKERFAGLQVPKTEVKKEEKKKEEKPKREAKEKKPAPEVNITLK